MILDNSHNEKNLSSALKNYNGLPLIAEDLHELQDNTAIKNKYLMSSLYGSGILNDYQFTTDGSGDLSLTTPIVLSINGDIVIVKNSTSIPFATSSMMGRAHGTLAVLGWYQHMDATSTLREYGGVVNTEITNDLVYDELSVQVSTRYQFRWEIVDLNYVSESATTASFTVPSRDASGALITPADSQELTVDLSVNPSVISSVPASWSHVEGGSMYVIPIFDYELVDGVRQISQRRPKTFRDMNLITSMTEPQHNVKNGTVWYNPETQEAKIYVQGTGFSSTAVTMGFMQYTSTDVATSAVTTAQDIVIPIGIAQFSNNELLRVLHNGLELIAVQDYTIDYTNRTITLLNTTREVGDRIDFVVTEVVEANNITNLSQRIIDHMTATQGNSSLPGHLRLSDATDSSSGTSEGIAATPKAVKDALALASHLIDDTTSSEYRLGIDNGMLYIEDV